jgi:hypothetical protein
MRGNLVHGSPWILRNTRGLYCRSEVTDWGGPSDGTRKTEALCHSRFGTIKIPYHSKALSAEHRPKFSIVVSLYSEIQIRSLIS